MEAGPPGPEARRGAVWGTLAAAALCVSSRTVCPNRIRLRFRLRAGHPVCRVFIPLTALAVALLLTIARRLPRMATGMIVGSCAIVMTIWGPRNWASRWRLRSARGGFLGATIATFVADHFRTAALSKKIVTVSLACLQWPLTSG